jgi:di/tricarboxylate transporter
MADQLIRDTILFANEKIRILSLQREGDIIDTPGKYIRLRHGDRLLLQAPTDELQDIYKQADLPIPENAMNEEEDELTKNEIYELVMLPNSPLINLSLQDIPDQLPGGIVFLAMHKSEDPLKKTVIKLLTSSLLRLEAGDRILVSGTSRRVQWFAHQNDAIVLRSIIGNSEAGRFGQVISVAALITVVVAATSGILTLMQSALLGVAVCMFTGILDFRDAYRGINWQVIFLLAGMIPLGIAMKNTGTDAFIAQQLNDWLSGFSPAVIISIIFLFTMIMSGFVSNNATAIIIAPVALAIAAKLGVPERPFIYAVMFAANFSFFTPIGYQTNAIIYGLGIYSFRHFLFIGGIVSLVIWLVASFMLAGYL